MSLQVWLPLNGDLRNQGLNGLKAANSGATVDNSGKIGKCYSFNGSQYITLPTSVLSSFTNEISVCAWVNITAWNSSYDSIVKMYAGNKAWNNSIIAVGRNNTASRLYFSIANGSSSTQSSCTLTTDQATNTWYHIACVYNYTDKNMKIYLNGELKTTYATTIVPNFSSVTSIGIGGSPLASYGLKGKLNDVRIYDHALSAKEVAELAKGLVLWYQLNGETQIKVPEGYQQLEYIESTGTQYIDTGKEPANTYQYKFKYALVEADAYKGPFVAYSSESTNTYRLIPRNGSTADWLIYFNTKANGGGVALNGLTSAVNQIVEGSLSKTQYDLVNLSTGIHLSATDPTDLFPTKGTALSGITMKLFGHSGYISKSKIYYFDTYNNGSCIQKLIPAKRLSDNVLGMYDVITNTFFTNAGTGTFTAGPNASITGTIYDASGYNNNGTIVGSLTTAAGSPRYGVATQYPDSACSIGIGNLSAMIPEGKFTFNIWFKKVTGEWSSKKWETILGGPGGFEFEGKLSSSTNAYIHPYSWGGGSTSSPNSYSIAYTLDEWHVVTMVRTASKTQFYLDGEFKVTGTAGTIPSGDYFIGAWKTAIQQNFRGYFSDARIYATALTADQVAELYRTSMIVNSDGTTSPRGA